MKDNLPLLTWLAAVAWGAAEARRYMLLKTRRNTGWIITGINAALVIATMVLWSIGDEAAPFNWVYFGAGTGCAAAEFIFTGVTLCFGEKIDAWAEMRQLREADETPCSVADPQ